MLIKARFDKRVDQANQHVYLPLVMGAEVQKVSGSPLWNLGINLNQQQRRIDKKDFFQTPKSWGTGISG